MHNSTDHGSYSPPLELIASECARIRAGWSERERNKRAKWAANPRVEVTTAPGFLDAIQESEAA